MGSAPHHSTYDDAPGAAAAPDYGSIYNSLVEGTREVCCLLCEMAERVTDETQRPVLEAHWREGYANYLFALSLLRQQSPPSNPAVPTQDTSSEGLPSFPLPGIQAIPTVLPPPNAAAVHSPRRAPGSAGWIPPGPAARSTTMSQAVGPRHTLRSVAALLHGWKSAGISAMILLLTVLATSITVSMPSPHVTGMVLIAAAGAVLRTIGLPRKAGWVVCAGGVLVEFIGLIAASRRPIEGLLQQLDWSSQQGMGLISLTWFVGGWAFEAQPIRHDVRERLAVLGLCLQGLRVGTVYTRCKHPAVLTHTLPSSGFPLFLGMLCSRFASKWSPCTRVAAQLEAAGRQVSQMERDYEELRERERDYQAQLCEMSTLTVHLQGLNVRLTQLWKTLPRHEVPRSMRLEDGELALKGGLCIICYEGRSPTRSCRACIAASAQNAAIGGSGQPTLPARLSLARSAAQSPPTVCGSSMPVDSASGLRGREDASSQNVY
eukprot:CAMPEP_0181217002 /NCGR_PEP_ID=MMETSP1096-20121128/26903_1 /TAXON_ID=156174 ORGANISM="Chrysochromulina ericina, Strain CCMP281" /NCGR_SAMPLE_ID=MMETSP1096 /ASSEMBLY_ACC=CAM_ASM_000453 /LENGTH=488 /DNA_ID=CAMNT_0023309073 /DNA_START=1 /DNA_END=1468 /DNA_ORIENTATION=-